MVYGEGFLPESQGQNLALTFLCVPYSLDLGLVVDCPLGVGGVSDVFCLRLQALGFGVEGQELRVEGSSSVRVQDLGF